MEHKNIYQLVLAGVLCAIGLVVPMKCSFIKVQQEYLNLKKMR